MTGKHEKARMALNYYKNLLVFLCAAKGCDSCSVFASLGGVPSGFSSSTVGLKMFGITAEIIKKKGKTILE